MANKITTTDLRADNYVSNTSRYADSAIIYYGDNNLIAFPTYRKPTYTPSAEDKYGVIPPGMEYRPDLVSRQTYGTPDFWWKIMESNNIKDIFDFKAGVTIRLPNDIFA
jgi:hypothetical protein